MPVLIYAPLLLMLAQGVEDAEGCRDSVLLSRKAGCSIESCSKKDFDSAAILTGRSVGNEVLKSIEGKTEEIFYLCTPGTSGLQIARNVSGALKGAGFQILFEGKDAYEEHAVTGRKGNAWITARTNSEGRYNITTVIEQAMQQELSAQWAAEIGTSGRAVIHGIEFETASARIRRESEPVLAEVLKLLEANPGWRMKVEGHTDGTGNAAANRKLSADRAASVTAWLIERGVAASRLMPEGFGAERPLESNANEAGRARNRRVELARLD
jgi:OmpA-OmpF porin, OOP family